MGYSMAYRHETGGTEVKKLLLVLVIAIIPAMAFAQFQIGGTALYTGDITAISSGPVSAGDFNFGGEARLKLWIFQVGATGYYVPDGSNSYFFGTADAGLSLNILFLRVGAGVGVNAIYDSYGLAYGPDMLDKPYNMKATVDLNLGPIAIGVEGIYFLTDFSQIPTAFSYAPAVGVSLLLKLF